MDHGPRHLFGLPRDLVWGGLVPSGTPLTQAIAALAGADPTGPQPVPLLLVEKLVGASRVDDAGVIRAGRDGEPVLAAASSEAAERVELAELRSGEGPGLETMRSGRPVTCAVGETTPWRRFSATAALSGYRAVHALPLLTRQGTLGAVELLYARTNRAACGDTTAERAWLR